MNHIRALRGIQPTNDGAELRALNARMDAAWRAFEGDKAKSVPLLRQELALEIEKAVPDQFFLLDIGYLLVKLQGSTAAPLGLQALRRIDQHAPIIEWNFQELFEFTHELAKLHGAAVLPEIDRLFLSNTRDLTLFQPPHFTQLNPKLICIFLYGVSGPVAETHLAKRLKLSHGQQQLILETLVYIGSEQSVPPVIEVARAATDPETFKRATTFLMTLGGPRGRQAVLELSPKSLQPESRKYYLSILPSVKAVSFETLAEHFDRTGPATKLSPDQTRRLLETMKMNDGIDKDTNPATLVRSSLPKAELVRELTEIRTRMFRRVNTHALDDVVITNSVLNVLQFRS